LSLLLIWQRATGVAFDPAPDAALYGWDAAFDRDQTQVWFAPELAVEALAPPAFDPATVDWGYDASTDRSTAVTWFQPDTEAWTPLPFLTVATVDQQAGLWPEQPGQERAVIALWHSPEEAHAPPIIPVIYPIDPSLTGDLWHDQSHQQARSIGATWFQPDTEAWVPLPTLTVATVDQDAPLWIEQPASWAPVVWFAPEDAAVPFVPTPSFDPGAGFDWSEQPAAWAPPTWFAPDASVEGLTPASAFDPAAGFDWSEQPQAWAPVVWHAPEAGTEVVPQGSVFTPLPSAQLAPLLPDQPQAWAPPTWFAPEASVEGPPPPVTFDPGAGFDWSEQPAAWTAATWFQPDTLEAWVPIPNLTVATVAQDAGLWQEQPAAWTGQWGFHPDDDYRVALVGTVATVDQQAGLWPEQPQTWRDGTPFFQPDTEAWTALPVIAPVFIAEDLVDGSGQQDRSVGPVWFAPEASADGFVPVAAAFDPATVDFGRDAQQDRSTQAVWFAPDAAVEGLTTGTITTATVAQQAGLWQDQSGQQDRNIGPTWHAPDAGQDVLRSLIVPTVASVDQQAPLWIEQPYPERGNQAVWYNQAVEPVDGSLQDWLFTVGSPGGGTPAVLVNAENGDVFLSIGGIFIVPAS
jgi:hypothetical protein